MSAEDEKLMDGHPETWAVAPLSLLGEWTGGATPSKSNKGYWSDGETPWVSPKDMKTDKISDSIDRISEVALYETAINVVPPESLLFVTRSGILRHSLPVAANTVPVTINQDIKALTLFQGVNSDFLRYQINARQEELRQAVVKTGVTVESVNFDALKGAQILLAPTEEQERIVNALDQWSSRIGEARYHVDAALSLADELQTTTIRQAFTENSDTVWPVLPLGEIVTAIVAGKNMRCRERPPKQDEKGVVKVSAVTWGEFDPLESKTLPQDFVPQPKTRIKSGDFLFSRANTLELVGACVIVSDAPDNLYLSDKILRLEMPEELKLWVLWYFRSVEGRKQLEARAHGTQQSMLNIPQRALLNCRVPLPPAEVREAAIASIQQMLQLKTTVESVCANLASNLSTLQQSILKTAFAGRLVPQKVSDTNVQDLVTALQVQRVNSTPKGRRPKLPRKTMDQRPLADQIVEAVSQYPIGISFGELGPLISARYEVVQQAIFNLLTSSNPRLVQFFNEAEKRMMLKVKE